MLKLAAVEQEVAAVRIYSAFSAVADNAVQHTVAVADQMDTVIIAAFDGNAVKGHAVCLNINDGLAACTDGDTDITPVVGRVEIEQTGICVDVVLADLVKLLWNIQIIISSSETALGAERIRGQRDHSALRVVGYYRHGIRLLPIYRERSCGIRALYARPLCNASALVIEA